MTAFINPGFELLSFFEKTPDLVCIANKKGFFQKVNPAVIYKLGYTEKELYAKPISSFIYDEDKDITQSRRSTLLDGEVLHNFVNRYVAKNGSIIWLEWTSIYFPDKKIVFAIAKDVTERKRVEKEVEEKYRTFKNLATHFKSSIEKDRKYFAYELHEDLAQLAAAIKLDVNWIAANVHELPPSLKGRIENAAAVSELLIKKIQRIAFSISPNMLDLFGLNETFEWLSNEFSILNGIPCDFESNYDEKSLTKEIQIDFFRICQEALTNITEHAEATHVKISIQQSGDKVELTITDDGKGFDIDQQKSASGLAAMRRRAESINGKLSFQSGHARGTRICLVVINKNLKRSTLST